MCEKEDNTPFEGCFPVLLIVDAGISFTLLQSNKGSNSVSASSPIVYFSQSLPNEIDRGPQTILIIKDCF